ncbi:MAG: YciI family protein [Alphaproteobacteria bacterium]|nr:YciI family protein [Alphaproteobacteria bacterium]
MKYMLLIYGEEAIDAARSKAENEQRMGAYMAYTKAMHEAGILVDGNRLKPTSAGSTVRVASGKSKVLDGPYADTKEQLGGYYMIDVPDLDQPIAWAAKCPGASGGAVEVRPVWEM